MVTTNILQPLVANPGYTSTTLKASDKKCISCKDGNKELYSNLKKRTKYHPHNELLRKYDKTPKNCDKCSNRKKIQSVSNFLPNINDQPDSVRSSARKRTKSSKKIDLSSELLVQKILNDKEIIRRIDPITRSDSAAEEIHREKVNNNYHIHTHHHFHNNGELQRGLRADISDERNLRADISDELNLISEAFDKENEDTPAPRTSRSPSRVEIDSRKNNGFFNRIMSTFKGKKSQNEVHAVSELKSLANELHNESLDSNSKLGVPTPDRRSFATSTSELCLPGTSKSHTPSPNSSTNSNELSPPKTVSLETSTSEIPWPPLKQLLPKDTKKLTAEHEKYDEDAKRGYRKTLHPRRKQTGKRKLSANGLGHNINGISKKPNVRKISDSVNQVMSTNHKSLTKQASSVGPSISVQTSEPGFVHKPKYKSPPSLKKDDSGKSGRASRRIPKSKNVIIYSPRRKQKFEERHPIYDRIIEHRVKKGHPYVDAEYLKNYIDKVDNLNKNNNHPSANHVEDYHRVRSKSAESLLENNHNPPVDELIGEKREIETGRLRWFERRPSYPQPFPLEDDPTE